MGDTPFQQDSSQSPLATSQGMEISSQVDIPTNYQETIETVETIGSLEGNSLETSREAFDFLSQLDEKVTPNSDVEEESRNSADFQDVQWDSMKEEEEEDGHNSSSEGLVMKKKKSSQSRCGQDPLNIQVEKAVEPFSAWGEPRFEVILESTTALPQSLNEDALTYLNKGQKYFFSFRDKLQRDEVLSTCLSICFHEPKYRAKEEEYWQEWAGAHGPDLGKALEIANEKKEKLSFGIQGADSSLLNGIQFFWNGKKGAKIAIKLNCLSTDFSRSKGSKGIILRLQTRIWDRDGSSESSHCRIQTFRDKGAERKKRDEQKNLEKKIEKVLKENPNAKISLNTAKPKTTLTLSGATTTNSAQTKIEVNLTGPRPTSSALPHQAPVLHPQHPTTQASPPQTLAGSIPSPASIHAAIPANPVTQAQITSLQHHPPIVPSQIHMIPSGGLPMKHNQIPQMQNFSPNVDEAKGVLPRPSSMPNLSNLTIVGQPLSLGSQVPVFPPTEFLVSHPPLAHTHLHHSHHPHIPHPYSHPHLHSIGHHNHAHPPHPGHVHGIHPPPRSSLSRSSSFSSTQEEQSPPSSNSSRCNSPERLHSFATGHEVTHEHFLRPSNPRRHTAEDFSNSDPENEDETSPRRKKRPAVLSLLLRKTEDQSYSAIYLDKLTAEDLKQKIAERAGLDPLKIVAMNWISKRGLNVRVDDSMVEHLEEETDFVLDVKADETGTKFFLTLH